MRITSAFVAAMTLVMIAVVPYFAGSVGLWIAMGCLAWHIVREQDVQRVRSLAFIACAGTALSLFCHVTFSSIRFFTVDGLPAYGPTLTYVVSLAGLVGCALLLLVSCWRWFLLADDANTLRREWEQPCRMCGYSLHANESGTCPECGSAVEGVVE